MDFLTRFGLEKSRFTYLMMTCLLAMGLLSYIGIPKREDPAITIRTAAVLAKFEGMSIHYRDSVYRPNGSFTVCSNGFRRAKI